MMEGPLRRERVPNVFAERSGDNTLCVSHAKVLGFLSVRDGNRSKTAIYLYEFLTNFFNVLAFSKYSGGSF